MPEPYLRSGSATSKSRSSRSSSRKSGSNSAGSRKAKSGTSRSRSAAASKKPSRSKKRVAQKPVQARPALLYCLALASIVAIGAFSIQAIHASAPVADGFEATKTAQTDAANIQDSPNTPPAAAELMRQQGWVAPASLELYERERRKSELPPEIAAVPETVIDTEVLKPQGDGYLPPPPIAGANDDTTIVVDGEQIAPSDDAVAIQGDDENTGAVPQNSDQIQSMLAGINNQNKEAPEPEQQPEQTKNQRVTLLQAQAQCADKGFISRIACNDRVRTEFCAGRWNEVAGCERDEDADF